MRITLLTHSTERGGSTSLLMQLRELFLEHGHSCAIVAGQQLCDLTSSPPCASTTRTRAGGWRALMAQYMETIERTRPELVYSISGVAEWDVLRCLRVPRIRHVFSLERHPYVDILYLLDQMSGFTEVITANTPDVLQTVGAHSPGALKRWLVPYRISDTFMAAPAVSERIRVKPASVRICFVGRLEPFQKRAHWLRDIIPGFQPPGCAVHWNIYGEGPSGDSLQEELRRHPGKASVAFHGWTATETLADELATHDILFLCSRWEGLPIAMAEAMLCGCACVVPAIPGGMMHLLKQGGGWFYHAQSPKDGVAALLTATADLDLLQRKKIEAQQIGRSFFAAPAVAEQWNRLVRQCQDLAFNGQCLRPDTAPRLWSVRPWVACRRKVLSFLGYAPEQM